MSDSLHLLSGTLTVKAKGYWYTGGGEKGSFGYYPHLKEEGKPVYPDTQLHGDLRMAALWAKNLGKDNFSDRKIDAMIDRLFGKDGKEDAALLHVGDLTVAGEWDHRRFQVKPRIEIDIASRTVANGMLANFEMAWLDGLTLMAPIYAGYFRSRADAESAMALLEEAAQLLSGFGAWRSRGYGRGMVCLDLKLQPVTLTRDAGSGRYRYSLTSLVNLRSKPVAAERRQLVETGLIITAEQLRGWFVKSYQAVTGGWPDAEQLAGIAFSDLIPSPPGCYAWPAPVTALRREDGSTIEDYWQRPPKEDSSGAVWGERLAEVGEPRGNKPKLKPLKPGSFVTAEGQIHTVKVGTRLRNAMADGDAGGTFITPGKGLFVQQYLRQGEHFSGSVTISDSNAGFARTIHAILSQLNPVINGGMLQPDIAPAEVETTSGEGPRLVTRPLIFDPTRNIVKDEGVTIGTARRYAPALGRPRRGRPVILPGSVLLEEAGPGLIAWPMFGKALTPAAGVGKQQPPWPEPVYQPPLPQFGIDWRNITRSQAGILRELLNPDHNKTVISNYLKAIHDKHYKKNQESDLTKLYGALLAASLQEQVGETALSDLIREIHDHLKAVVWWGQKADKNTSGRVRHESDQ